MSEASRPFVDEERFDVCITCPARILAAGEFNVSETPSGVRYDRALDYRVDRDGNPTCVHPLKIGLTPGNYIGGVATILSMDSTEPETATLSMETMPYDIGEVQDWLIDVLRTAGTNNLHRLLPQIEEALIQRFNPKEVVEAFRFALSNL